jgi:hypothetical protein
MLKQIIISLFCFIHLSAIIWWAFPQNYAGIRPTNNVNSLEYMALETMALKNSPRLSSFLRHYIDLTGSQQYWDFFAPDSPRYHQYLSVCNSIETDQALGKINCTGQPGFSNLDARLEDKSDAFRLFGSDQSRHYRLTENLIKLEDSKLLAAFTRYYGAYSPNKRQVNNSTYLVLHLFELHPELNDLPKSGYRMDKILLAMP